MKKIAGFIFWLISWKIDQTTPLGIKKCVIVVGPHTSNWDFVLGRLAFVMYGVNAKFLIKKELFFPPLSWLLKALGGLPVDRSKRNNLTETALKYFKETDTMFIVFSPEGTRSYNPNWKKGFYYIAQKAEVPICICYVDYFKKIGGFHSVFYPTGDVNEDILHIKNILKQYKGRFPEKGID